MEFRLDDGQVELQQTVQRFFEDRFPLDALAGREPGALDRDAWAELADMGVFGLLVDEGSGGSGLGVLEGALVFELVGSHLVSGPLLWTVLAAGLVDGAASGERVVGGVEASAVGDDGSALVEHAADLDALLVVHADRVAVHDLPPADGPGTAASSEALDPLTPVGRVAVGEGMVVGDADVADRLRLVGTVLAAAALTGVSARALETARAYALERHQFDVPIGSFQAVKHLLADMYVRTALAQSSTYAAAAVLDDPGSDDPGRAASAAKLLAAEAAIHGAGTAIQVLGGMGFTWEMLPNYLLKRAWVLEHTFGTEDHHADSLGASLARSVAASAAASPSSAASAAGG